MVQLEIFNVPPLINMVGSLVAVVNVKPEKLTVPLLTVNAGEAP